MEMKLTAGFLVAATLLVSGCASTVTTYDASGKMIGKCEAKSGFILAGGAGCSGTSNGEKPAN